MDLLVSIMSYFIHLSLCVVGIIAGWVKCVLDVSELEGEKQPFWKRVTFRGWCLFLALIILTLSSFALEKYEQNKQEANMLALEELTSDIRKATVNIDTATKTTKEDLGGLISDLKEHTLAATPLSMIELMGTGKVKGYIKFWGEMTSFRIDIEAFDHPSKNLLAKFELREIQEAPLLFLEQAYQPTSEERLNKTGIWGSLGTVSTLLLKTHDARELISKKDTQGRYRWPLTSFADFHVTRIESDLSGNGRLAILLNGTHFIPLQYKHLEIERPFDLISRLPLEAESGETIWKEALAKLKNVTSESPLLDPPSSSD